jgi:hypothetical protein
MEAMTYLFRGSSADIMAAFFEHVGHAHQGSPNADTHFRRALICLVGLYDRQAQGAPAQDAQLREFRRTSCEDLAAFDGDLTAYVHRTQFLAEGANDDEWYELCMRRSVIQSLVDDYAGTPVAAFIDHGDVAELDDELRRVGEMQGPVPAPLVPKGLPSSHWWWRYPEHGDEGER